MLNARSANLGSIFEANNDFAERMSKAGIRISG
ncbi:Uncharacterised protein [Klebsiella pneumoniae]|nr:Uncharacterised protein [Klebsiella pneumoniae]VGE78201.1 Uncharacterised protein [Klebsiella pneumoniae]